MIEDEILNQIFENRLEKIEENIQAEYHKRVKSITNQKEKSNIKISIISELYYKEGFKDGINFTFKSIQK